MSSLEVYTKQPRERLDYDVDYEKFFDDSDTDDIDGSSNLTATVDGTGVAPDLVIDGGPIALGGDNTRRAKVWLSGGVNGRTYKVTVTATTHDGRVIEQDFKIKIKEQ